MQLQSHRRSFVKTTILASSASMVLILLIAMAVYLLEWNAGHQLLPGWGAWLVFMLLTAGLAVLAACAALVAVGGVIVLHRDLCEERGLPYLPARERERVTGPMMAAFLRFLNPRMRL